MLAPNVSFRAFRARRHAVYRGAALTVSLPDSGRFFEHLLKQSKIAITSDTIIGMTALKNLNLQAIGGAAGIGAAAGATPFGYSVPAWTNRARRVTIYQTFNMRGRAWRPAVNGLYKTRRPGLQSRVPLLLLYVQKALFPDAPAHPDDDGYDVARSVGIPRAGRARGLDRLSGREPTLCGPAFFRGV